MRLSPVERRLLAKAAVLIVVARFGLWLMPFALVRRLLEGLVAAPIPVRDAERHPKKVVWAVEAAGRRVPRASTCLTLALASQVLLARRGNRALVRIGVAGGGGSRLEAHAWVESAGEVVVGGPVTGRYAVLATLGTNGR